MSKCDESKLMMLLTVIPLRQTVLHTPSLQRFVSLGHRALTTSGLVECTRLPPAGESSAELDQCRTGRRWTPSLYIHSLGTTVQPAAPDRTSRGAAGSTFQNSGRSTYGILGGFPLRVPAFTRRPSSQAIPTCTSNIATCVQPSGTNPSSPRCLALQRND